MTDQPFDFEPRTTKEEKELEKARIRRSLILRKMIIDQMKNRFVGALLIIPGIALVIIGPMLSNLLVDDVEIITTLISIFIQFGGMIIFGLGLRMLISGRKEQIS